jgi:DNA replication protein DnaC
VEVVENLLSVSTIFEFTINPKRSDLSHAELIRLLVDSEKAHRENLRLERLLHNAKLKQDSCLEDIEDRNRRGLNKQVIFELSVRDWIKNHQNILISGATGVGKTYICCALGNCACRLGYSVCYVRAPML